MQAWTGIVAAVAAVIVVGCAMWGTGRPPTEECWIAIRSYSAMLETATEWYEENPAGEDEKHALRSVIEGAKPLRQGCEDLARACEGWAAESGKPVSECPQSAKMSSTAISLGAMVEAANTITREWDDDTQ